MKKLPTAPTVPSRIFSVWLTMAPPDDAMVPALGRPPLDFGVEVAGDVPGSAGGSDVMLLKSK